MGVALASMLQGALWLALTEERGEGAGLLMGFLELALPLDAGRAVSRAAGCRQGCRQQERGKAEGRSSVSEIFLLLFALCFPCLSFWNSLPCCTPLSAVIDLRLKKVLRLTGA